MKKLLIAAVAALMSASSIASIALSGKYTGTLNDSGTYTQDLTTTLAGWILNMIKTISNVSLNRVRHDPFSRILKNSNNVRYETL